MTPERAHPLVEVDLGDGEIRHLKYTAFSSLRLKQVTGKGIGSLNLEDVDEGDLIYITWAMLLHENPKLTPEAVAAVIDPARYKEIGARVGEALMAAFPEAAKRRPLEQSQGTSPARDPTGS